jgi:EmrB/QacA subfamily drug resistance transporter
MDCTERGSMSWLSDYGPPWSAGFFRARRRVGRAMQGDRRRFVLVATILGSSMTFLDGSVVNVALPRIGRDLGLGLAGKQWVFLAYTLVVAALYLPAGAVGDRFGELRIFAGGILGFALVSAACGASPSGAFLIGARALQGLPAAFLAVGSLALLRSTYGRESGHAVGLWTAWTGVATIVGPPVGGALVQFASWRLIFYINVPVALAAAALLLHRPAASHTAGEQRPFDLAGTALFALGFSLLTYALVAAGSNGFSAHWWELGVAAAALAAAVIYELRSPKALLPRALFRRSNLAAANAETLLVYAGLIGSNFFLVLYLQLVIGYSPFLASLTLLPVSIVMIVAAGRFGRLSDRLGPRLFLVAGPSVMAIGMLVWMLVTSRGDWPFLAAGLIVFALGLAMTVAPITATALQSAPPRMASVAAAVNNAVARVGGLVSVALIGVVIANVFSAEAGVGRGDPFSTGAAAGAAHSAAIEGFRAGLGLAMLLCLAGALVAAVGISNRSASEAERAEEGADSGVVS